MKTILESIASSFSIEFENEKLHKHEILAVKNLVEVAKERIWVADHTDASEYNSLKFDEFLSIEQVNVIKQSITVLENLLKKRSETNEIN